MRNNSSMSWAQMEPLLMELPDWAADDIMSTATA